MAVLRSILFWPLAGGLTLVISLAALPTLLMPRAATYRVLLLWARGFVVLMRVVCVNCP